MVKTLRIYGRSSVMPGLFLTCRSASLRDHRLLILKVFSVEVRRTVSPTFPPGGITAWYTMRLTALGEDQEDAFRLDLPAAIRIYEDRDAQRCIKWRKKFSQLHIQP